MGKISKKSSKLAEIKRNQSPALRGEQIHNRLFKEHIELSNRKLSR
jgi:hypothetical protein